MPPTPRAVPHCAACASRAGAARRPAAGAAARSPPGARNCAASVGTATATSVTTTPWPAENSNPDQRESSGRRPALKRVMPSIAARWSGSSPCLSPNAKTTARSASQWLGSASIMRGSLAEEELVPQLFPFGGFLDHGGGLDDGEREIVEAALHARAGGDAPPRFQQAPPPRGEGIIGEKERG